MPLCLALLLLIGGAMWLLLCYAIGGMPGFIIGLIVLAFT